ncbi:hypothetical protein T4C_264 [Trichinella pseudospiralis]|uniref:Uncharacterized protein n=1 Tax=Trichinella pseudospiralis TaxID=6337 RepID=A0A0V1IV48_TRIPS|nr:hypothetical protein T4C_264 [Trichinella pseudospiralis]
MTINKIAVDLRFVENDLFQLEVHKIYLLSSTILQFRKTLESTLSLFIVNAINIEMMYEVTIVDTLAYQTMENVVQVIAFLGACKESRGVFERVMSVFVKTQSYSRMLTDGSEILLSHTWIKA